MLNIKDIFKHKGQYERELEIFTLKKFIGEEFKELCKTKILDLDVTYAYSEEPVPFSERNSLEYKPIKKGEIWARKNFACAWFHLTGKLPENVSRDNLYLEFCNDAEGLLVDNDGHALKGFTAGSLIFGVMDYNIEKRFYPLDKLVAKDGTIDLYIDGASNGLVGEFVRDVALSEAAIVRRDPHMNELYHDFDVLFNYTSTLQPDSERKFRFVFALRKVMNMVVYNDPDYYAKSKEIINELFNESGIDNTQVTAVGHAHMDLAWLWPIRETKRKILRTFASVIYLMERYPDFHFVVSQPQQVAWVKELDPKLYEKIKKYVAEGRLEPIGGGWVENDTNVPCEESMVRQELYGQKFWKEEFGDYVDVRWLPDTFGYSACIPQVLKKSRQNYFMTIKISWSNRTLFPYHTFRWEGIDDSSIIVHMPPEGTYNSLADPKGLLFAESELKPEDPKEDFLMVYGVGDGGGGPSETMVERILREEKTPYLPKVKMERAADYFHKLDERKLADYKGEMYLEKHRATYTSQNDNKYNNREFEGRMVALEMLLSALGKQGDKTEIDKMWKEVLLYQFHDILPGSSISRVYRETAVAYKNILDKLENIANGLGYSYKASEKTSLVNFENRQITALRKNEKGGYLYYAGADKLVEPSVYANGKTSKENIVATDDYTIEFAADGSIKKLVLNADGRVVFENGNKLRVFIDRGDAWDFDDDYRDQPEVFMTLTNSEATDFGDLVEVRQAYEFKNSKLVQTIVIHKHDPIIRVYHDVDWKDSGYMMRAEFMPQTWSVTVRSDIQFGYLDRPTTDNTEHEAAQYEICCQKWLDINDGKDGFAVINNVKNGYMAKQGIISLDLARAFNYPCENTDCHPIKYSYAIYPHVGVCNNIKIDELAKDFNGRFLFGNTAVEIPYVDNEAIDVTAFKPAYDGDGFILRMNERNGNAAKTNVILPEEFEIVCETDLLEEEIGNAPKEFEFKPFEIRSFRIKKF